MERHCSTGQSPQWTVVPMEEEEVVMYIKCSYLTYCITASVCPDYVPYFL